ncbi:MAG: hypothetical protein KAW00_02490 [Dehalococcoidia bacterium]|nr:hypothetical protein [Dehalococcoidia bacterium]
MRENGVFILSQDADILLQIVRKLRLGRTVSSIIMRFAPWGFTTEHPEVAVKLAAYTRPPNYMAVADATFLVSTHITSSYASITDRTLPLKASCIDLDRNAYEPSVSFLGQPTPATAQEEDKAIAFGDMGGFLDWQTMVAEYLPPNLKKGVSTKLSNEVISTLKEGYERTNNALCPEKEIGIGTDGTYIVSPSPDSLLRLIIWVQSALAHKGLAFVSWILSFDTPQYNLARQPSGEDFLKSYGLQRKQINGDVLATRSFVQQVRRPELLNLVKPSTANGQELYEVQWSGYPFRIIPKAQASKKHR